MGVELLVAAVATLISVLEKSLGHTRIATGAANGVNIWMLTKSDTFRKWGVFFVLFLFMSLGVASSFYLVDQTLELTRRFVVTSIVITLLVFSTTYAVRTNKLAIAPEDIPVYFKEGFIWPAALPTLAQFLGITTAPLSRSTSILTPSPSAAPVGMLLDLVMSVFG